MIFTEQKLEMTTIQLKNESELIILKRKYLLFLKDIKGKK